MDKIDKLERRIEKLEKKIDIILNLLMEEMEEVEPGVELPEEIAPKELN